MEDFLELPRLIGHVSLEAALGGPIAFIKDRYNRNDMIDGKLNVLIDESP